MVLKYLGRDIFITEVPRLPRDLIYRIFPSLISCNDKNISQIYRRAIVCFVNGGLPLHLFHYMNSFTGTSNIDSKNFEYVVINFNAASEFKCIKTDIEHQLTNFKSHLLVTSRESSFRSLFWDQVITKFFFLESDYSKSLNYRLCSEWKTQSLFPTLENRIIDFVGLTLIGTTEYPVLLVETGSRPFDFGPNAHKDFSKLLGIMSKTCISMAHELEANNKCAEHARVYGIWIGGSQIQFCVAHPVITQISNNSNKKSTDKEIIYEIHCNLTFFEHWKFDLLHNNDFCDKCSENCCAPFNGLENLVPGNKINYSFLSQIEFKSVKEIFKEISIEEDSEENVEEKEEKQEKELKSSVLDKLYKGEWNLNVLGKLRIFIRCVLNRFNILNSEELIQTNHRKFIDPKDYGLFPQSRKRSNSETPMKDRISKSAQRKSPKSPTRLIKKRSTSELKVHLKLSIYNHIFPKIFNVFDDKENELIEYEFEEMLPFIDDCGRLTLFNRGNDDGFIERVYEALRFTIHCSFGLFILHKVVGLVHSDISPNNILFSTMDNVWKITDFDQTLPITVSKSTVRIAGTEDFISTESIDSGIFTEESDIFSLGKVILDHIYANLLVEYVTEFEERNPLTLNARNVFIRFEKILFKMTRSPSSERIKIEILLQELITLIERLIPLIDDDKRVDVIVPSVKLLLQKLEIESKVDIITNDLTKIIVNENNLKRPKLYENEMEEVFLNNFNFVQ